MDPDGGNVERVTSDPSVKDTPVMTSDGEQILFTMNEKGQLAIAVYDVTERTVRALTPANCNSMNPSIGPDGRVVFSSDRDGNLDLYSMTLDGENITRLTTFDDAARTPAWAHGEESIVYAKRGSLYLLTPESGTDVPLSTKGDICPHWTRH
jgi:TolB protein